jgi:hypothetical protein
MAVQADLRELWNAVDKWRTTKCSYPRGARLMGVEDSQYCDGENHQENCDAEIARQDLLATHNRIKL